MTDLSPEEIAALRAEHPYDFDSFKEFCGHCYEPWPCPTVRLIEAYEEEKITDKKRDADWYRTWLQVKDELEASEEQVQRLREALKQISECSCDEAARSGHEFHCGAPTARAALHTEVEVDSIS